jgi:hypothetical protein
MYGRKATLAASVICLTTLLASCVPPPPQHGRIVPLRDEFSEEGWDGYALMGNQLGGKQFKSVGSTMKTRTLDLCPTYIATENVSLYSLRLWYSGDDWIFIKPGESLVLLVDGERIAVSTEKGSLDDRNVTDYGYVHEWATYYVEPELIVRLCHATEVKVKVYGDDGSMEGFFEKKNFENICMFVERFIESPQTEEG